MNMKSDTCPYCKTAIGYQELTRLKRAQQRWGTVGLMLGLMLSFIGAGLGIYLGANT